MTSMDSSQKCWQDRQLNRIKFTYIVFPAGTHVPGRIVDCSLMNPGEVGCGCRWSSKVELSAILNSSCKLSKGSQMEHWFAWLRIKIYRLCWGKLLSLNIVKIDKDFCRLGTKRSPYVRSTYAQKDIYRSEGWSPRAVLMLEKLKRYEPKSNWNEKTGSGVKWIQVQFSTDLSSVYPSIVNVLWDLRSEIWDRSKN